MFTSIPVVFTCVHVAPLLASCTHILDYSKYWLYVVDDVLNIPLKISVHACMHMCDHDHGFKKPPSFSSGYAPGHFRRFRLTGVDSWPAGSPNMILCHTGTYHFLAEQCPGTCAEQIGIPAAWGSQ